MRASFPAALLATLEGIVAVLPDELVPLGRVEIFPHHLRYQLGKRDLRPPAELLSRLRGISEEGFDLGRTKIPWIDANDFRARSRECRRAVRRLDDTYLLHTGAAPRQLEPKLARGYGDEVTDAVLLPGGDDKITWFDLLQD